MFVSLKIYCLNATSLLKLLAKCSTRIGNTLPHPPSLEAAVFRIRIILMRIRIRIRGSASVMMDPDPDSDTDPDPDPR